jgi:hypothetical protein
MPRIAKPALFFATTAVAFAFACATSTAPPPAAVDAGIDAPPVDLDAQAEAAPKTCLDPPDIKIIKRNAANAGAPDDQDCDVNDTTSIEACKYGRCAGWTDPADQSTHGKCVASCTEMNKQPGQVCYPGAICRTYANTSYCLPTRIPLCSADGGSTRGDGGCLNSKAPCTYDTDCCSGSCNDKTLPAKCD